MRLHVPVVFFEFRLKSKDIHQMKQLFCCAVLFFRDLLYYSSSGVDDEIIFRNQMGKIDKLTKNYPQADWYSCIQHIENTQNFISRNGYLPLQMICLFIDIQKSLEVRAHGRPDRRMDG